MKVAFFSCSDFVEGNAATSRLRAYAKGLKELGVSAAFFSLAPTQFNFSGLNIQIKGVKDGTFFKYICGSNRRSNYFLIRTVQKITSLFRTFGFLISQGKRFDVFYLYQPSLPEFLPVYVYSAFVRKPVIAEKTEYDLASAARTLKDRFGKLIDRINFWLLPFVSNHLVVITQKLKATFISKFKNRITIIPALVDLSRFKEQSFNRTNRVGYIGSFAAKDNVVGIIEAYAKASKHNKDLKLRLIGFDPCEEQRVAQINKAGLNGKVEMTGQVTYNAIPDLLSECDLLIANKTTDTYSEYGFPTKITEYMATGRPVIATDVGDISLFIKDGENGFLVEAGNTEALASKMLERYNDYEKYDKAGKQGKSDCEVYFNYKVQAKVLKEILEKVRK